MMRPKKKREKEILSLTYFTQYDNLRSIHVAAKGIYFVLFVAENYSTVYMYHIFIHSSVDGHLGCLGGSCFKNARTDSHVIESTFHSLPL